MVNSGVPRTTEPQDIMTQIGWRMEKFDFNPYVRDHKHHGMDAIYAESQLELLFDLEQRILKADALRDPADPFSNPQIQSNREAKADEQEEILEYEHQWTYNHEPLTYSGRQAMALVLREGYREEKARALRKVSHYKNIEAKFPPIEQLADSPTLLGVVERAKDMYPEKVREYQAYLTPEWKAKVSTHCDELRDWYKGPPNLRMSWAIRTHMLPFLWDFVEERQRMMSICEAKDLYFTLCEGRDEEERQYDLACAKVELQKWEMFCYAGLLAYQDRCQNPTSWELMHCVGQLIHEDYSRDGECSRFAWIYENHDSRLRMFLTGDFAPHMGDENLWWSDVKWSKKGED